MKKILIFIFILLAAIPGIAQHFTTVWTGNGYNQMNINILEAKLSLVNLEAGDEIAAYDGSLCVGVVSITGAYTTLTIAVSQVDAGGDGYTVGNPIILKYWDASNSKEVTAIIKDNAGNLYSPNYPVAGVSVFVRLSGKTELTITIGANNKTYDGDVLATVPSETVVAHGIVTGQLVSVAVSNARFDTKAIGTGKTVTASVTLSGPDAANYTVSPTVTTTADILAKVITITPGTGQQKVYRASDPALSYTSSPALISPDVITGTLGRVANENAGTYAYTLGSLTAGSNYSLQIVGSPATFEITKAVLTVTADNKTKVYGATNPELTFEYSGWVNGVENIDVAPSISTAVTTATAVGPNTGSINLSGGSDNNYTFSFVAGSLAVTKAELTATADNKTKTYGAANPTLTLTYSGWGVNGVEAIDVAPSISTTVTTETVVGANTGSITLSGGNDNNYTLNLVAGSLAVTKADQTITWADPANIVYNTALSATQLNATVSVPGAEAHGALTYNPALDVILNAGTNQALLVEVAGSSNYNAASKTVHINVNKADQSITWANPSDIVYNTALSATQLNASVTGVSGGSATGAVTYVPVSGTVLNAGASQDLTVNVAETSDYNAATKTVKINVNKAEQTITWSDPSDIEYGTALSSTQLNASVAGVSGGSATGAVTYVTVSGTVLNAGASQDLTVNVAATSDYNAATKTVKINVSKANQTITWSNPSDIVYGTALSATQLNATVSVPGVEAHGALTYTPSLGVKLNVGTNQALKVDVAGSSNYNSATATVHINVVKADQTITWADPSDIAYSTSLSATQLNATVSAPGVEAHGALTYTPALGVNLNVGASQALLVEVAGSSNYNAASKTVHINVTKADQTITWSNPADIVYGTALSTTQLNATVSVPGVEAHGALTYTPALGVKMDAGNNQALRVDVAGSENYNAATITVYINVIKANQTITWAAPSAITYGTVLNATQLNASVAGISGGSAAGELTYDPAASTILGYGNHTISVTAAATVNYFVATADVQITVNKKTVTAIVTASNKQYDGNNVATIATRSLSTGNIVGSDDVTVTGGTATFNTNTVQDNKLVTAINLTLSGTTAVNYQLSSTTANTNASILRKQLTLNAFGNNKIYDKTTGTIVNFTDDRITGEDFTVNYTGNFVDSNAGIAKTINVTGIWLSGTNADNYTPPSTATTTADITAKDITVTAAMSSKIYDGGTTSAGVPTISPALLSGDVANFIQAFDTKAAATGTKNIIPSGSVTDGNSGLNYAVTFVPITNATISRKNTTGTITAPNKIYDGTTTATISNYSLSGVIFGDAVTLSGNATFADKVVQNGKTVTASDLTLGGIDYANYVLTSTIATTTANITTRALSITLTGVSRVYDRGIVATVTVTDDRVSGDDITYSYTATFDDKNAGISKSVSVSGISKSGTDAGNYTLSTSTGSTTANITQKALVIDITAAGKNYDGTPAAVTHASITSGLISGDVVSASSIDGAFNDKNAGIAKPVTANVSISGTDVANYSANTTAATTANINTIALVIGITAEDKNYDGTLTAVTHASITSGLIADDVVSVSSSNGLFSGLNVGPNQDVTADVSKSGTDSGNYTANTTATAKAAINKANLAVTAVASGITFGGSAPVVSVTYGSFQNGENSSVLDNVGFTLGTDYTQWNNAGTYHTTISAGTATDNNYNFTPLNTSTFGVTKANAVIAVTPYSVNYNGSSHTATFTAVGIEPTPADLTGLMTVSGTTHTNAGTYIGDAWSFAGNTNYNATSGTVNNAIAKIDATIAVSGFSGTYDGAAHGASGTASGLAAVNLGSLLHVASTTYTNVPGGSVAWTFDGDTNYNSASGTATVTINKANAVIAVTPYNASYDGSAHTATFTAVGVESTPADLAGLMDVSGTTHTDAGTYATDSWSFAGNTNYNTAGATITDAIGKIDATVAVTGFSGTYDGNAHGIVSSSATGLVSLDLGSLLHVDATTYTNAPGGLVHWTFDGETNYKSASGDATVTINKANLTITADNKSKDYGAALPALTVSYTGLLNGATTPSTLPTISTTGLATSGFGTYPITASGAADINYTISYVDGTLTITKVPLLITSDNKSKIYGDALPALTLRYTGLVNGDLATATPATATTLATALSPVGTYSITASGAIDENYNISYTGSTLTITRRDLHLFTFAANSKVYNGNKIATGMGWQDDRIGNDELSFEWNAEFESKDVGERSVVYTNIVLFAGVNKDNYNLVTTSGTAIATISQRTLAISANNVNKTYGATLTGGTGSSAFTPIGLQNGETIGSVTMDYGTGSAATAAVGTYTGSATPSAATGGTFTAGNYTITYPTGNITVDKADLTITANSASKSYGAALPTLTVSYAGFVNGDLAPATLPAISTTGLATSAFGTYPITATGAADANYNITYIAGTLSVDKVPLLITAENKSKAYGAALPTLTVSYTGLVNGDLAPANLPTIGATGLAYSGFGTYPITASGAVDANYTISYAAGTLTVDKVALLITAVDKSKAFGDALPELTVNYTGLVNGDLASATLPTISTTGLATSALGAYPITATDAADANYTISYVAGTLDVTKRLITITADALSKNYGDPDPELTYHITSGSIIPGDLPSGSLSRDAGEDLGMYAIHKNTLTYGSNYDETFVGADFEILRSTQTISLVAGWNIVSFNLIPTNQNMLSVLQPLIDGGKLIKVMDESGNSIENVGGWLNDIGNSATTEGYKVKVTQNTTLEVNGSQVILPIDIPLIAGWNIISYPDVSAQNANDLLQALMTSGKLLKVMDESGNAIEKVGSNWFSDIENFIPGEGYKVKVNGNCTLTINHGPKSAIIFPEKMLATTSFNTIFKGNGYDHMNVYLLDLKTSGFLAGDEVGIYDGKNCVGAARIDEKLTSNGMVNIPVSCNDGLTEAINGYIKGNTLSLKLIRDGQEFNLKFNAINNSSDRFVPGSSAFIIASVGEVTSLNGIGNFTDLKCYPNPFTEELYIEINRPLGTILNVEVFDVLGRKVSNLYPGTSNGFDLIKWNGTNTQGTIVRPGVYYVRCNGQVSKGIIKK